MTVALDRDRLATLLLTLDGYRDRLVTVPSRPNLAVLWNVVFGWAFGLAVDVAMGNLELRRTDPLFVWLVHNGQDSVTRNPVD